jgi:hypothetical protein
MYLTFKEDFNRNTLSAMLEHDDDSVEYVGDVHINDLQDRRDVHLPSSVGTFTIHGDRIMLGHKDQLYLLTEVGRHTYAIPKITTRRDKRLLLGVAI